MRVIAETGRRSRIAVEARVSEGRRARFLPAARLGLCQPIDRSELFHDPGVSRYALRCFAFGTGVEKKAVFSFDGHILRVMTCRVSQPRRIRKPGAPPVGEQA